LKERGPPESKTPGRECRTRVQYRRASSLRRNFCFDPAAGLPARLHPARTPSRKNQWHQCPNGPPYGSGGCSGFYRFPYYPKKLMFQGTARSAY